MTTDHAAHTNHAAHGSLPLTDALLTALTVELAGHGTIGLALGGSYAFGTATRFSDADFAPVYPDDTALPSKYFFYREGLLVSVSPKHIGGWREQMRQPSSALFAVLSIRALRILRDDTGALQHLQNDARAFTWETLQPAANSLVSRIMLDGIEWVHKLLGGLAQRDTSTLAYAVPRLALDMTEALALHRGVFVDSQNTYFHQVQHAAGLDSLWTQAHLAATGANARNPVNRASPSEASTLQQRARAALALYAATAALVATAIQQAYVPVVEATLALLKREGTG